MRRILALIVLIVADVTPIQVVADPIKHPDCIDAHQLYVARSPECRFVWARYAAMMTPEPGFTREEIEHQKAIMDEKCPATSLDHHWLIENTGTVNDPDLMPKSQSY